MVNLLQLNSKIALCFTHAKIKKMKQLLFSLLVMSTPAAFAQNAGKIIYEQKVDNWKMIPEDNAQMRSMVPQYRSSKYELHFANNQSFYKASEAEPDLTEENNNGVVIRMGGGAENEYYKNFATSQSVEKRELMGDIYLVTDSLTSLKWKLEDGPVKNILGHNCKKATATTARGSEIIAWYAEDMPAPVGPEQFYSLPGTILSVEANKGAIIYTAISIEAKPDDKLIKAPTKGKKTSLAAFNKTQSELIGNRPGGIRIVNN